MKLITLLFVTLLLTNIISAQSRVGIGIGASPDLNFYKYSNFSYDDFQRTNKFSLGSSIGIILNYKLNNRIDLFSNSVYSVKNYAPDRTFHFGVLRAVKMKTLDIPVNVKYKIKEFDGWINEIYLIGGLTYQIELYKKGTVDWFSGFDERYNFIKKTNYIFPNIGIGAQKEINVNTKLRFQINSRFFKCHCEYLNPIVDKIGFEFLFIKALSSSPKSKPKSIKTL